MTAGIKLLANETVPNSCLRYATATFFNKGEDSYDFRSIDIGDDCGPVHAFGIFDGHNGPEGSHACKESLLEYIESECAVLRGEMEEDESPMDDWPSYLDQAIGNAFRKVDTDVRRACDAGTTATVCLIRETESGRVFLKTASVGDSRAVAGDGINSTFDLTTDHKVSDQYEKVRITICENCNSQEELLFTGPNAYPSHDEIARNRKLSSFQTLKDLSVHGVFPGNVSPRSTRYLSSGNLSPEDSSDEDSGTDLDEQQSESFQLPGRSDALSTNGDITDTPGQNEPQGGMVCIRTVSSNGEEIKIQPLTNPKCRHCQHRKPFIGRFVDLQGRWLSQDRIFCTDSLLSTNLSRSIGARELSSAITHQPEIMDTTFKADNKGPFSIVLASDGVWDVISSQRANNCTRRRMSDPSKAALRIVTKAKQERIYQGHRPDDITAVVIHVAGSSSSRAESPRSDISNNSPGKMRWFFGGLCVRD